MAGNAWIWAWTSASSPKRLDTSLWSRPRSTRRCRSSAPGGSPSYLAPPGPKISDEYRLEYTSTSLRAKLPEVADEPLPLVDAAEAELHWHLEANRGGIAVGELAVEAAATFQIRRDHHGGRIGAGHQVVLGEGKDLAAAGKFLVGGGLWGGPAARGGAGDRRRRRSPDTSGRTDAGLAAPRARRWVRWRKPAPPPSPRGGES